MSARLLRASLIAGLALVLSAGPAACKRADDEAATSAPTASNAAAGASALPQPAAAAAQPDFASIVQANGGAVVNIRASSAPKSPSRGPGPRGHDPFFEFFRHFQIPEPELPRSGA